MRLTRCATSFTLETLVGPSCWRFGDKNLRIENVYFSLFLWLNAGFRVRGRKEGDPASNKTNLRNPCPRKPYLEAPGRLVKHRVQKEDDGGDR